MKIVISTVAGIIICLLAQLYLPIWWIFVAVTFAVSYFAHYKTSGKSFLYGFITVVISWLSLYLFKDTANASIMSDKMATLFSVKSNYWLFGIASVVMGVLGGLTSMAAWFINKK